MKKVFTAKVRVDVEDETRKLYIIALECYTKQRQGIGSMGMKAVEHFALQKGCDYVYGQIGVLGDVKIDGLKAFYKKNNFSLDGLKFGKKLERNDGI